MNLRSFVWAVVTLSCLSPITLTRAQEELVLEPFTVTGSRVPRLDPTTPTPQPVVHLSAAELAARGHASVGEALRALSVTTGRSLVPVDTGLDFATGASGVNLRGRGHNNTLVLINGRRAAPFASAGWDGFQTIFDYHSLPLAAIESIELLKDGASAIYGSDAVAGVVNVRLRDDFTGVQTTVHAGNTVGTDSFERGASALIGTTSDRVSVVTAVDWREREALHARDLDYADSADGREFGGFDQTSSRTPIARVYGLSDRERFPGGRATFATPQVQPTLAAAGPHPALGYNYQEEAGFLPRERMAGFFTRATVKWTEVVDAFAEFSVRRSVIDMDSASTPLITTGEQGDGPGGGIVFPTGNPFNPFGEDILDLRWRMQELGLRRHHSQSDTLRALVGLEGNWTGGAGEWAWTTGLWHTQNTTDLTLDNYTADERVQAAFRGVEIEGVLLHANPFGPNDPRLIDYLRVENRTRDTFEVQAIDASATGPLFALPAGEVALATGVEARREALNNRRTPLNESSGLVGGGAGASVRGERDVAAAFAELSLPLLAQLEVQAAVRVERYSDFGTTAKPKVAALWRPLPEIALRGSYGRSFLAPNLAFLHSGHNTSFTTNTLADPLRPDDPRQQIKQLSGGNPNLQPEEADVTYAGVVLQPFARRGGEWWRRLVIGVDYLNFDQTDLLGRPTPERILGNLDLYGDLVVRNAPAPGEPVGTVDYVTTTWRNLDRSSYAVWDFSVRWDLPESVLGQFSFAADWSTLRRYDFNGFAQVGGYGFPRNRGNVSATWARGDWSGSLFVNMIGPYSDAFRIGEIDDQVVVNPQLTYAGFDRTRLTVGLRNAFDEAPPVDISDVKLVNDMTNHVEPLFWYVRMVRDW